MAISFVLLIIFFLFLTSLVALAPDLPELEVRQWQVWAELWEMFMDALAARSVNKVSPQFSDYERSELLFSFRYSLNR